MHLTKGSTTGSWLPAATVSAFARDLVDVRAQQRRQPGPGLGQSLQSFASLPAGGCDFQEFDGWPDFCVNHRPHPRGKCTI